MFVPLLLEKLKDNECQVVMVLNHILARTNPDEEHDWIELLLQEYLEIEALKEPLNLGEFKVVNFQHTHELVFSAEKANQSVITSSAVLEGISLAANLLTTNQFAFLIMDGLYTILEKLGSSNYIVNSCAVNTLEILSDLQFDSKHKQLLVSPLALDSDIESAPGKISKLVTANIDYILDTLSRKLKLITRNPMAPKVLMAAVTVAEKRIIPALMVDVVDQVLDILDEIGTGSKLQIEKGEVDCTALVTELLQAVLAMVNAAKHENTPDPFPKKIMPSLSAHPMGSTASKRMQELMTSYDKRMQLANNEKQDSKSAQEFFSELISGKIPEDVDQSTAEIMTNEEDDKPLMNQNQSLIVSIYKRVAHFLSSDSAETRLLVLKIYAAGLPSLKDVPLELNPIIASIWPRIIARTKDTSFNCAVEALNVIGIMITLSPEFCRKRVQDDVIKNVLFLLQRIQKTTTETQSTSLSKIVRNQLVKGAYISSTDSQLYNGALKIVGYVLDSKMVLKNEEECKLVVVLIGFLNIKLYADYLVEMAINMLIIMYDKCGDWMWLVMWVNLGGKELKSLDGTVTTLKPNTRSNCKVQGNSRDLAIDRILPLFRGQSSELLQRLIDNSN